MEGRKTMTDATIDDNPRPWCPLCKRTLFPPVTFVATVGTAHQQCVTDACNEYMIQNPIDDGAPA